MKENIIIHTTARFDWQKYGSQELMEKFLLEYWGVFPEDLKEFSLNQTGKEACLTLFRLATEYKKPWRGVGYKEIIEKDGTTEELTAYSTTTNGAAGYNLNSIHIAWDGGIEYNPETDRFYEVDNRTEEQKAEILNRVRLAIMWSNENGHQVKNLLGHRDVDKGKACPLFDVKEELGWIFV